MTMLPRMMDRKGSEDWSIEGGYHSGPSFVCVCVRLLRPAFADRDWIRHLQILSSLQFSDIPDVRLSRE